MVRASHAEPGGRLGRRGRDDHYSQHAMWLDHLGGSIGGNDSVRYYGLRGDRPVRPAWTRHVLSFVLARHLLRRSLERHPQRLGADFHHPSVHRNVDQLQRYRGNSFLYLERRWFRNCQWKRQYAELDGGLFARNNDSYGGISGYRKSR